MPGFTLSPYMLGVLSLLPHSHFHSSSWSQARVLFLHGQSTSAKLVQKILEDRGWFHDLPLQFFIPDGTHAVDAWSNKYALKTLGLTGLVDAGLYDTSGKQFMWGARFSSLLEDFGRTHPIEALKAKVPFAAAITLRLLRIFPHAIDSFIGRYQAQSLRLSDMAKDAGTKDPKAKW